MKFKRWNGDLNLNFIEIVKSPLARAVANLIGFKAEMTK